VSQRYCRFYTCGKTIVRVSLIELIEFVNETLTKIVQLFIDKLI